MNWAHPTALLLGTWLVVFGQVYFTGLRGLLHAQPDLLPAMVVYAALYSSLPTTLAVALLAGLGADAWSSGPFGLGAPPLVMLGWFLHHRRELILRDSRWAQAAIGAASTLASAVIYLGLLLVLWPFVSEAAQPAPYWPEVRQGLSEMPVLGPGRLWQLLVLAGAGAACTPLVFVLFRWVDRTCNYQPAPLPGRPSDRVMERGRSVRC